MFNIKKRIINNKIIRISAKRISASLLLFVFVFVAGCSIAPTDNDIYESEISSENVATDVLAEKDWPQADTYIFFDKDTLSFCGEDASSMMELLQEMGEDHSVGIWANSEGEVYLAINEEQRTFWLEAVDAKIDGLKKELLEVSPLYDCEISDHHTVMNVYYDRCCPDSISLSFVMHASIFCVIYQIIEENYDYALDINIFNKDTENLVANGSIESGGLSYGSEEWYTSYCLDQKAEGDFLTKYGDDSIVPYNINSAFQDAIVVIDILCLVNSNQYSYMYINENGEIVMGLTEEERQDWIDASEQYLLDLSWQLSKLGEAYQIEYGQSYSEINLYFDANLSEQDQADYIGNSEIVCMLWQALNGQKYYTDINIYNSKTGELVSSGNTADGIEWKME